jgi:hypothetical protein
VKIRSHLIDEEKAALTWLLKENMDVFARTHQDIPGIDPAVITHKLNADPSARPVRQKPRFISAKRSKAIAAKVEKLKQANFIKDVRFSSWVSNVLMVRKYDDKWRMCVDFTNLNKACPKDSFPLPMIDLLVDSIAKHELRFPDAFSGYNQIQMDELDKEKTTFITDCGLHCYKVMPFGLKNAGATYQKLMNHMFRSQIGRNVEVYVDDMLVKSKIASYHVRDLEETFQTLRHYSMKLNPVKCAFGVSAGKFLGFIVSQRGIEANPEKIQAIMDMQPSTNTKQLQQLTGRVAALNRFVSRATDKCLPFFKILRKAFLWGQDCDKAFEQLKEYLAKPLFLSRPREGEPLHLYLTVSPSAVRSALMREDSGVLRPMYFSSRALRGAETRYP